VVLCLCLAAASCGSSSGTPTQPDAIKALQREARPIGQGPRFHEPVRGVEHGPCRPRLGHRVGAHIELYAADRVVLLPPGIGVHHPTAHLDGRITRARCYGDFVTLDPTGVVLVRAGSRPSLADLFSAWGQPVSRTQLAAFPAGAGKEVRVYVDGRRRAGAPATVLLQRHSEIVLEVGPYVPPHHGFSFLPSP
jgi:hypothetical protein